MSVIDIGVTDREKAQSRDHRMRWLTLAVVSVTVLLATIDETILNVAIPSLQRDLGASASSLQSLASCRSNTNRSGTPTLTRNTSGE